jgi:UDP-glucose 4-epimerase
MRWLVTGGCGVIGSLFSRRMVERGDEVQIIDHCPEPRNEWLAEQLTTLGVTVRRYRLESYEREELASLLDDVDAVLHAAAHTGIPHSVVDPDDDWRSNVDATKTLLDALRMEPKPTVVLSSVKPFSVQRLPLTEDSLLLPDEPYAASKMSQVALCQAYGRSYGVPVIAYRCSNLYGPAPPHGPRHGWLTWFCVSAAMGRALEVQGSGDQTRDMLHADDVTSAVVAAIEVMQRKRTVAAEPWHPGETFNLGGGLWNSISVNEAAKILREMTGVDVVQGPPRSMDDDRVFVSTAKMEAATGWRPSVAVVDGIRDVLQWAQENQAELRRLYEGV